mmetsp:Transcript_17971/g.69596  ORF Transcript_17971/g.69596 Transcript_17971/m.69596 type:complete len:377 (-) Transcript_17971:60-1190(-)
MPVVVHRLHPLLAVRRRRGVEVECALRRLHAEGVLLLGRLVHRLHVEHCRQQDHARRPRVRLLAEIRQAPAVQHHPALLPVAGLALLAACLEEEAKLLHVLGHRLVVGRQRLQAAGRPAQRLPLRLLHLLLLLVGRQLREGRGGERRRREGRRREGRRREGRRGEGRGSARRGGEGRGGRRGGRAALVGDAAAQGRGLAGLCHGGAPLLDGLLLVGVEVEGALRRHQLQRVGLLRHAVRARRIGHRHERNLSGRLHVLARLVVGEHVGREHEPALLPVLGLVLLAAAALPKIALQPAFGGACSSGGGARGQGGKDCGRARQLRRSLAVRRRRSQVRAVRDQRLDAGQMAVHAGDVQGREALAVHCVGVRAFVQHQP